MPQHELIIRKGKVVMDNLFRDRFPLVFEGEKCPETFRWVNGSGFTDSSTGEDFKFTNLLTDYYLFQLVEHSTRGNNILDLVMTNTPTFIQSDILTGSQWSDGGRLKTSRRVLMRKYHI